MPPIDAVWFVAFSGPWKVKGLLGDGIFRVDHVPPPAPSVRHTRLLSRATEVSDQLAM